MDRGFDGAILVENIIESGNDFIIRAKSLDRIIYINNKKTKIKDYAKKIKD